MTKASELQYTITVKQSSRPTTTTTTTTGTVATTGVGLHMQGVDEIEPASTHVGRQATQASLSLRGHKTLGAVRRRGLKRNEQQQQQQQQQQRQRGLPWPPSFVEQCFASRLALALVEALLMRASAASVTPHRHRHPECHLHLETYLNLPLHPETYLNLPLHPATFIPRPT